MASTFDAPVEYIKVDMDAIKQKIDLLKSWEWTFARGPKFNFGDLTVEEGLITDHPLTGQRFDAKLLFTQ